MRRLTDTTKEKRLQRRLGMKAYRIATERRVHHSFPVRSNPVMMEMTKEFPGVDIDAIHYDRRFCKRIPRV